MNASLLIVSPFEDDIQLIGSALKEVKSIRVSVAASYREAVSALTRDSFRAILCDATFSRTCWKDLLSQVAFLAAPPAVLLMAPAEERALWTEAVYLGIRDVLAKPLDRSEVRQVVHNLVSVPEGIAAAAAANDPALPDWAMR